MPLTFRKSVWVVPGFVRLNINRRSWSLTFGFKGFGPHWTWSSTGRNTTSMDLPGGAGYRRTRRRR
jgi:hypothetical protein